MSRQTTVALEVVGVLVMLATLGAGYALLRDGSTTWQELAALGGFLVFGALLVEPTRVTGPLVKLWAAYKGTKP